MNRKKKRRAENPGIDRIFALYMVLTLAGLTGCGRQGLEFYTEEELAEASKTATQDEETTQTSAITEETAVEEITFASEAAAQENTSALETAAPETVSARIFVDVCGAVANPGVYELAADSRVFQAIELAGGYLPEAAQSYLNRASVLTDGQQIYVPTQAEVDENPEKFSGEATVSASGESAQTVSEGETGSEFGGAEEAASDSKKVNLNTADISELVTLTGIGESKAQAIIAYREANGSFQTTEDLMKVDGIKEGTYSKIKDQITVG